MLDYPHLTTVDFDFRILGSLLIIQGCSSFWDLLGIWKVNMEELVVSSRELDKKVRDNPLGRVLLLVMESEEGRFAFDLIDRARQPARCLRTIQQRFTRVLGTT